MKVAILAMFVACAVAMPSSYNYGAPTLIRSDYGYVARPEVKLVEVLKSAKEFVPILKHEMLDDNKGTYKLEVHTGDGQTQIESAHLKDLGNKKPDVVKEGSYSFISPEGRTFTVNWKSDENGFQAVGDHLPTSPPMPEEIRKALALPRIPEYQEQEFKLVKADHAYNAYGGYARF